MRIYEFTSAQQKLELMRTIDTAIWQAIDQEAEMANAQQKALATDQTVATTPTTTPKPQASSTATPVKTTNTNTAATQVRTIV